MFDPFVLSKEHEDDAQILDKLQRKRYADLEQQQEWKRRGTLQDGTYSLTRLLSAMQGNAIERDAPYEWSTSQRIAKQVGREPRPGFCFVPVPSRQQRDFTVASQGANLVQTGVAPGDLFAFFLDTFFQYTKFGITRVSVPRLANIPGASGNVSTNWLTNEGSTISESQFDVITKASTPKTVGAFAELSDRFIKQAPFGETIVLRSLARAVAAEMSRKILVGSGTNGELQGIFGTSGITTLPAASANYAKCLDAIGTLDTANALLTPSSAGFVLTPSVAKLLRARERATGSGMVMVRDDVSGYPSITTSGSSPNTLVFADWSQLVLLEYGLLEIGTDPYGVNSASFTKGIVGIRCLWTVDVILLNPASFVVTGALS